jgi:hypothetical protein
MTDAVDAARERMGRALFASWDPADVDALVDLLQRFADDVEALAAQDRG